MTTDTEKTGSGRLIALDAFRGITIAAMIMVNYPGSWDHLYPPLLHADWHGITTTDLICVFIICVPVYFLYRKKNIYQAVIWIKSYSRQNILYI